MISTKLLSTGLGNQIFFAIVPKVIAYDRNLSFGVVDPENWHGKNIIDLDFGEKVTSLDISNIYQEKMIRNSAGIDITPKDDNLINVPDGTLVSGIMQSVKYFEHRKKEVCQWLKIRSDKVNTQYSSDDTCCIHIRGNDYTTAGNTMLPQSYYKYAMAHMKVKNPKMKFVVVTDDYRLSRILANGWAEIVGSATMNIPDPYRSDWHGGGPIEIDYAILNSAKNIILSNSTFGFWPAYTNMNNPNVICPFAWCAFNYTDGSYWSTAEMRVNEPNWRYINRGGEVA